MLDTKQPYFFENEEWYYYDAKKNKFFLTDKAPQKAIISYKEFYNQEYHLDSFDYNILMEAKNSIYDDAIKEGKSKEEATKIANDWWEKVTK